MYSKLAWRNIWRNKRRTLITLASISFAVFFAAIMQSMQFGSYGRMIDNAVRFYTGFIQVHHSGYWDEKSLDKSMPERKEMIDSLRRIQSVQEVVPRLESFALASYQDKTKGTMVVGIDPEAENNLTRIKDKLIDGNFLTNEKEAVLLSEGLAEYLKIGIGDTLVMLGQGYHGASAVGKFPVEGILKFPIPDLNNQSVYMPLKTSQWFYAAEGRLTAIAFVLNNADEVEGVMQEVTAKLNLDEYEVMDWRSMMPELIQQIELDYVSGKIILYILYAIIGFGMFGTFLMMTSERSYEFGIMVAIGMRRFKMQLTILLEMILLGLSGVIVGIILSLPIIIWFHYNPILMTGDYAKAFENFGIEPIVPFSMDPSLFLNQGIVVLIMSLILGIYPVYYIQRFIVTKALRK
ncbi:FtsX-like permease family protein [Fulvivirgaceae bacterium BMA10]|uniref:FtsX-like permease family protein n=1 Tax=Splendidivirga corallicola TaxID=3051826 RepID=A0ABT8KH17_9BACT|nr:FtsX-like permease family protein [Fulvivirgaceae bacterium BMA10]